MTRSRMPALLLTTLLILTPSARATWSIVLTDMSTGEVAVGTATCLEGFSIKAFVPVILVGVGAAATQSQVDPTAKNKKLIVEQMLLGTPPSEIIQLLKTTDALLKCSRQYGIVDMLGRKAAFSGACNGQWKGHVTGQVGSITYSIQGNVLTGEPVILAAEQAVVETEGLLSDRLMAGMIAAASLGGDGRCSCLTGSPPSCGSPPVDGFEKSAHVGSMIVARIGDTDGGCAGGTGCATGDYWMELNFSGFESDLDPVFELKQRYDGFVKRMRGQPDALASEVLVSPPQPLTAELVAVDLELDLRDLHGLPVPTGGADIAVGHAPGSAGLFHRAAVHDHGDGTYSVRLVAEAPAPPAGVGEPGTDLVQLVVRQGDIEITLFPYPAVQYGAPPR